MHAEDTLEGPAIGNVVLGRYRIVRMIARGGMGVVYLGRHEGAAGFTKPVVIKSITSSGEGDGEGDGEGELLFAREARIVSQLQHPNIVAVLDFGRLGTSHVMVLEYLHGYNLRQWARYVRKMGRSIPAAYAVHVVLAVADALDHAHSLVRADGTTAGIVHRDVSPANVLIDAQGRVKLTDFGIACAADDGYKTQQGLFRGTLSFAAPEVLQGAGATATSDQYSCGVLLYEMLAGANPFRSKGTEHTISRVLTHTPDSLDSLRNDVPQAVGDAVARAIAKDPALRFPTVAAFAEALRAGSTWSERDVAREFAQCIASDFNGDLATVLGVESLAVRDDAWRNAQAGAPAQRVSLHPSSPAASQPTVRADALTVQLGGPGDRPAAGRRFGRSSAVIALAGLAAVALAVVLTHWLMPAKQSPRGLVILETQSDAPSPAAVSLVTASAGPPVQPTPAGLAVEAPSVVGKPAAAAKSPAAPSRGVQLAYAFQRRQQSIQTCFGQVTSDSEGASSVSVRFQVDRTGSVQDAALTPSSVASTPFGRCLLGVARSTQFGPQAEPVSFSIPIAARVVKH